MAETNDVSMAEEEEVSIIEEGENVRPKRSLSISSTDNTPSKRRRVGTKPTKDRTDAENKKKEREDLKKQKEEEKQRKLEEREQLKKQKELEKLQKAEEREELKKQKEETKKEQTEAKIQKQKEQAEAKRQKEEEKIQKQEEQNRIKKLRDEQKALRDEQKAKKKEEQDRLRAENDEKKRLKEEEKLQKEREKQQKEEEQKALVKRQSAALMNFFVKGKVEAPKQVGWSNNLFRPFEVKANMKMAPLLHRNPLSQEAYDTVLSTQVETSDYLTKDAKQRRKRIVKDPLRAKYFHFHDNYRPPYYGTWRKISKTITGRRPFTLSHKELNYEIDSDAEWEEERAEDGDDCVSEPDEEGAKDEFAESGDDEFYVDHGYLSENEGSECSSNADDEDSSQRKRRLDHRAHEFKNQRSNKSRRLKKPLSTQTYGFNWELDPITSSHAIESRLLKAVIFDFPPIVPIKK